MLRKHLCVQSEQCESAQLKKDRLKDAVLQYIVCLEHRKRRGIWGDTFILSLATLQSYHRNIN